MTVVKASVKDALGNAGVCVADVAGLDEAFTNAQDVFQGLETMYLQKKSFRDGFNMWQSRVEIEDYSGCELSRKRV